MGIISGKFCYLQLFDGQFEISGETQFRETLGIPLGDRT